MANKRLPFLRTFSSTIVLDQPFAGMGTHTVSGPINFTADVADAEEGYTTGCVLVADGTNTPTFTGFQRGGSTVYDNTAGKKNQILFYYLGGEACYAVSVLNATTGLTTLNVPGSFNATAIDDTEIDLSWADSNSSPNESGYTIYWNGINDFGSAAVLATPAAGATSYNHTGLGASTSFYYWIKANGNGTTTADSTTATDTATTMAGSGGDVDANAYVDYINGLAAGTITDDAPYQTLFTDLKAALGGTLTKIKRMYLARFTTIALDSVNMVDPGTHDIIAMSADLQLSDDGADNQDGDATFAETDSMTAWGVTNTDFCCMIGLRPKIGTAVTTYNAPFGSTINSDDRSVRMRWTDSIDVKFNASDLGTDSTSNTLGAHHYAVSRSDNTAGKMYIDGALFHTQTIAASALPTTLFGIGAERNDGGTRLYPIVRPWYYFIGASSLTATEIADVTDAWETFMDSFGKGLI